METRQVIICGHKVDVNNYGNATYLYPSFNGNAEYRANHKEFRKLSHYLRTVNWLLIDIKEYNKELRELYRVNTDRQPKNQHKGLMTKKKQDGSRFSV